MYIVNASVIWSLIQNTLHHDFEWSYCNKKQIDEFKDCLTCRDSCVVYFWSFNGTEHDPHGL